VLPVLLCGKHLRISHLHTLNSTEKRNDNLYVIYNLTRAWGSVVVKALCWKSMGPGIDPRWFHWGFFPGASTVWCALGSTQPLKMSNRIFLGVKAAGALGWRPYYLHSAECREDLGALTSWNPTKPFRLVAGNLYLYLFIQSDNWRIT
jgi:hypothetical protein